MNGNEYRELIADMLERIENEGYLKLIYIFVVGKLPKGGLENE